MEQTDHDPDLTMNHISDEDLAYMAIDNPLASRIELALAVRLIRALDALEDCGGKDP